MRRLIVLASVVALTLSVAAPGLAKPDKTPPGREPLVGFTCSEWEFDDPGLWMVGFASDDFSVELTAATPAACVDVTSEEGAWSIDDIEAVEAASLQVQIKDSVPGDFCFREDYGSKKNPIPDSIEVWVPAAGLDACTPGEVGLAADQDPALVFMVSFVPERRAAVPPSVAVHVALP